MVVNSLKQRIRELESELEEERRMRKEADEAVDVWYDKYQELEPRIYELEKSIEYYKERRSKVDIRIIKMIRDLQDEISVGLKEILNEVEDL